MNVQMRHALANTVVHRHKGALRFERKFHCAPQQLHILEEWTHQNGWQVAKRFEVAFGNQQAVTWKERAMIEKRDRNIILKHERGGNTTINDSAEETIHISHNQRCSLQENALSADGQDSRQSRDE